MGVNHKVIQRLHKLWGLPLLRSTRPPRPSGLRQAVVAAGGRANLVARQGQIGPFEVTHTDFTELRFADGRQKAYLMPLIGHTCKMAYGWAVGERTDTRLALTAWQKAKATFRRLVIPYQGMIIHHDQDPVYTGHGWTGQLLLKDGLRLSYALNGARGNPEMESFISRFPVLPYWAVKEENHSLFLDARSLSELAEVVNRRMWYYNVERRHSTIGYLSPLTYIEQAYSECPGQRSEDPQ